MEASVGRAGSCLSWKVVAVAEVAVVAVAAAATVPVAVAVRDDEALLLTVPLAPLLVLLLPTAAEVEAGLCWALGWAASRSGLPLAVLVVVLVALLVVLLLRPLRLRLRWRWRWLPMVALAGRRRSSCVSADGADGATGCDETRERNSYGRRPGDRELSGLINAASQP